MIRKLRVYDIVISSQLNYTNFYSTHSIVDLSQYFSSLNRNPKCLLIAYGYFMNSYRYLKPFNQINFNRGNNH